MPSDRLLPPGARLIHIGPQKTGSTSIQNALHALRDQLGAYGVYYAGQGERRPRAAGRALLGKTFAAGQPVPPMAEWESLVAEVDGAGDLRVCVSNEDFAKADADQAGVVVRDLGGARAHVIAVARRLDRLLPSQWQQLVKGRLTIGYEEYLERVLDESGESQLHDQLWRPHHIETMVARWLEHVDPDRFTLVIADDDDRAFVPGVLETMLGLPQGLLSSVGTAANPSLTLNEAELLRAVNREFLERGLQGPAYTTYKQVVIIKALRERPSAAGDLKIPALPSWAAARVRELSDARAEAVRSLGVNVAGDPDDLRVPDQPGGDSIPSVLVHPETAARAIGAVIERALRDAKPARAVPVRRLEDASGPELLRALAARGRRRLGGGRGRRPGSE